MNPGPLFSRARSLVRAAATGVALGSMSRKQLHARDERYYDRSRLYDTREHLARGLPFGETFVVLTLASEAMRRMITSTRSRPR